MDVGKAFIPLVKGIDVGKLIHDQNWLMRNQGKFYTFDTWPQTL